MENKGDLTDKIGKDTLEIISEAHQFNKWMFHTILPFTKGTILEVGSGVGNISKFFLEQNFQIMLSDFREEYCLFLKNSFGSSETFLGVDQLDIVHPEFEKIYKDHLENYDAVFALNVIEHIQDDRLAIFNCKKLLRKNGHLIILVPSYQKLYNKFDEELGHFKRYNKRSLLNIFLQNDLKIIHQQQFNFIGIFGWYLSGGVLKRESIPSGQMKIYNRLVPLWKLFDQLVQRKVGLSTIAVGKK